MNECWDHLALGTVSGAAHMMCAGELLVSRGDLSHAGLPQCTPTIKLSLTFLDFLSLRIVLSSSLVDPIFDDLGKILADRRLISKSNSILQKDSIMLGDI